VLASTQELRSRGKEPPLEATSTQHLALSKGRVAEVLTSGAALHPAEALKLTVISECPVLHTANAQQYSRTTPNQPPMTSVQPGGIRLLYV